MKLVKMIYYCISYPVPVTSTRACRSRNVCYQFKKKVFHLRDLVINEELLQTEVIRNFFVYRIAMFPSNLAEIM